MNVSIIGRYAFGACAVIATLSGCGGANSYAGSLPGSPGVAPLSAALNAAASAGISPGYMRIKFDVAAPLEFSKYQYLIVLNTAGDGKTPEADGWAGYSFALETNRQRGAPSARAVAFVRNADPHIPPAQVLIATTPRQFRFNPNSNGSRTEFAILFQRSIFDAFERRRKSTTWLFNAFSENTSGFVDSMGSCESCFVSPKLSVDQGFDKTALASKRPKGIEKSAKIASVEFTNDP
jgi:hypothetical protein